MTKSRHAGRRVSLADYSDPVGCRARPLGAATPPILNGTRWDRRKTRKEENLEGLGGKCTSSGERGLGVRRFTHRRTDSRGASPLDTFTARNHFRRTFNFAPERSRLVRYWSVHKGSGWSNIDRRISRGCRALCRGIFSDAVADKEKCRKVNEGSQRVTCLPAFPCIG